MNKDIQLDPSKWVKPNVKPFGFLKGTTKLVYGIFTAAIPASQMNGLLQFTTGVWEILESVGFKKNEGQLGWRLISRSLQNALFSLIVETKQDLNIEDNFVDKNLNKLDKLDKRLNSIFCNEKYYLNLDFFKYPEKLPLLEEVSKENGVLNEYLKIFGYNDSQRQNILRRLKKYFVFALVEEWRKDSDKYKKLIEKLDTPFSDAKEKAFQWMCYRQFLIKEIHNPVFQETFDLSDIYIPLRAFYKIENKYDKILNRGKLQIIENIDEYLIKWLKNGDKDDCVKMISGGPGFGKSSLLKILAAYLAKNEENVLFIPLHRFKLKEELEHSIKIFLNYDKLITSFNPIDEDQLTIIFDGLDELYSQDCSLADEAKKFIEEVIQKVKNYNYTATKIKVIISGRDVISKPNETFFEKEGQIIHLLPYFVDEELKSKFEEQKKEIFELDQRQIWWKKYSKVKNKNYDGLPEGLNKKDIDEITAQPLLNYLVALSYERGKIDFTQDINLNKIYDDLLDTVYERSYSSGGKLQSVSSLKKENFARLLEIIAVSAWHGEGRITSIREIKTYFEDNSVHVLWEEFIKDAKNGIFALLVAFYFRQVGQQKGDSQTFEFTHKSFSEFLMARRIVTQIKFVCEEIEKNKVNDNVGFNVKTALKEWIKFFGPKVLDDYIVRFIKNEIAIINIETLKCMQQLICELINFELREGLPVELLPRKTYKEENHYALNAEKSLFVILSIIATNTNEISNIKWQLTTDFGNLLRRMIEQPSPNPSFMRQFFNHIDINRSILECQSLFDGKLNYADLSYADLKYADLRYAGLSHANLSHACLSDTYLDGADLSYAILNYTDFSYADFKRADLFYVDLSTAKLEGAKIRRENLKVNGINITESDWIARGGIIEEE